MKRLLLLFALFSAAWAGPARAADGIPARPKPFTFVTDQAGLLQPADVKRLDNGLRRYADNTGTQVVVVTLPSLGDQDVNATARQIGTTWGIGQQGKNNGLVVLVAKQEHKLSIEPGSGLRATITPSVIQEAIGKMTPQFKQNNYLGGLEQGLNLLMVTANPGSAPNKQSATTAPAASGSVANDAALGTSATPAAAQAMEAPAGSTQTEITPVSTGIPWGTILIGAAVVIGGIWLVSKLFGRKNNAAGNNPGGPPNFYPNQQPQPNQPTFYPNQGPANYNAPQSSGGMGSMGGILATGAAAAAGAYLGNRLGGSHESGSDNARNFGNENTGSGLGTGAAAGAGAAATGGDYFSSRDSGSSNDNAPDYFSDNSSSDDSGGFFSGNDSSYDDSSGGGGFDDTNNDNSGSW